MQAYIQMRIQAVQDHYHRQNRRDRAELRDFLVGQLVVCYWLLGYPDEQAIELAEGNLR